MGKKKCKNCGYPLEEGWNYCPNCGMEIPKFYDKFSYGLDNLIEKVMADLQNMFMQSLFPQPKRVEIRFENNKIKTDKLPQIKNIGLPITSNNPNDDAKKHLDKRIPPGVEVLEAETLLHKVGKRDAEIQLKLPDTEEKDIDIIVNFESVEIRALSKDKKLYFKMLEIPKNTKLVDKKKDKDVLYLRFSK